MDPSSPSHPEFGSFPSDQPQTTSFPRWKTSAYGIIPQRRTDPKSLRLFPGSKGANGWTKPNTWQRLDPGEEPEFRSIPGSGMDLTFSLWISSKAARSSPTFRPDLRTGYQESRGERSRLGWQMQRPMNSSAPWKRNPGIWDRPSHPFSPKKSIPTYPSLSQKPGARDDPVMGSGQEN